MLTPEVFLLDDEDGHAYVTSDSVPEPLQDKVRRAAVNCPEMALEVVDAD